VTAEQLRAAILAAMRAESLIHPYGQRRTFPDIAVAIAHPAIDQARAAGMRDAAAMLRRYCPKHDVHGGAETFMSCHCAAADQIDRDAAALSATTT
jgi:hypothetical protein